ncbi:MAG: Glu/Leu/Phe/Val dehydrogenase, partial [Acidobacteriota bacterium]
SIGGIRMAPDVTTTEVFRLARSMTWKNALAGIPHGGGKSGILADPSTIGPEHKETLIRQFARAIEDLDGYIPGPDMGTDEVSMAWIRDEIGRSVGLSKVLGGIPLDQIGATGFGLAVCAEVAQDFADVQLDGARVIVQGFGNVGSHAARYLKERGSILVAASDLDGTIYNPNGIDVDKLSQIKRETGNVTDYGDAQTLSVDAWLELECDIFVPAARPDVIDEINAPRLNTKVILQGANIPVTARAERILHDRGILSVPDFVANAGGVICASVEYKGGTQRRAFETIDEKIRENTREVLEAARAHSQIPAEAARALAKQRVAEAMAYRRR